MPDKYWRPCNKCGDTGMRYYLADGRTGWRCLCGHQRPDQPQQRDLEDIELPEIKTDE